MARDVPGGTTIPIRPRVGHGNQVGARPGCRRGRDPLPRGGAAGRVPRWRDRAAGVMTLFHFGNCFALAYFPYFITYKCSGL